MFDYVISKHHIDYNKGSQITVY